MSATRLAAILARDPQREALWTAAGPVSCAALLDEAQGFIDWAAPAGGRIALALPNSRALVAAYIGALLGDIPIVPLGAVSDADRHYILDSARVAAVATPGAWGAVPARPASWPAAMRAGSGPLGGVLHQWHHPGGPRASATTPPPCSTAPRPSTGIPAWMPAAACSTSCP